MNQHLQSILDFIQQDEGLTAEEKNAISKSLKEAEKELEITAFKLERTEKVKRTTAILLEETIEELEQKRKAVEAQNHDLEIETSLEKVRAIALSMKDTADMLEVCSIITIELDKLGVKEIRNVQTAIFYEDKGTYMNYEYYFKHNKPIITETSYTNHKMHRAFAEQMLKGKGEFFSTHISKSELPDWITYQKTTNVFIDTYLEEASSLSYYWYSLGPVALGISTYIPLTEDDINLFKRFRNVFELAYRRFLDIELAIKQAKEARIETALERVRAVAMAMKKSEEVINVCEVMYKELLALGFTNIRNAQIALKNDVKQSYQISVYSDTDVLVMHEAPYNSSPIVKELYDELGKSSDAFMQKEFKGKKFNDWRKWREGLSVLSDQREKEATSMCFYLYSIGTGHLGISTFNPINSEQVKILKRFKNVFELSYTRYIDVAQAEAQTREAEIQLAMERVRARTMAMQKSDELPQAASLLFQQVQSLGMPAWSAGYCVWDEDLPAGQAGKNAVTLWMSSEGVLQPPFRAPLTEDPSFMHMREAHERGEALHIEEVGGEELITHYKYMRTLPVVGKILDSIIEAGHPLPTFQINHCAYFSQGFLLFITYEPVPEAHDIFKRFAKVFEQTYTRFLDLQKAEAQAREAQIEAALEKVRSRSLAMHKSDELIEVVQTVFEKLDDLNIEFYTAIIVIFTEGSRDCVWWLVSKISKQPSILIKYADVPYLRDLFEAKENGKVFLSACYSGEDKKAFYDHLIEHTDFRHIPEEQKQLLLGKEFATMYIALTKNIGIHITRYTDKLFSEREKEIIIRFSRVFDQAYTRFLDLQKAEAQAREATKQASLDRVRGEIASMRSTNDLQKITPLIFNELTTLGVPFIRCGVFIINETENMVHVYLSAPDGHSLAVLNLKFDSNELPANAVEYWRKGMVYHQHWSKEDFINWTKFMMEQGQVQSKETYQGAAAPPQTLDLHFIPFTQGMLYVGNIISLHEDEIALVKSLAEAFSIAYARYEDFNKLEKAKESIELTLTELRATQKQLVQSEKMASLGELTAGIAHEIQNPLNFVNNFSEVNKELLVEMKDEMSKGNLDDAKAIANDVIENEEKINHHGKRADAIVKGMLQHSRSSTGVKEPTDINALCDEYLRLSYHGLRAKDNSFNATIKTDFDRDLSCVEGKINIVPQDIGRVLLNLYNNAFYAINEKKKTDVQGYEPRVLVKTKKINNTIELTVRDNGNGIPQNIVDKIFQPFFTTKPTGEGTGLGLSLSYDIIKAHGGEIKVNTKENEGTEFIIQLPII